MGRDKLVPPIEDWHPRRRRCTNHVVHADGRNRPVHHPPVERDNRPIIVFVTICTKNRKQVLADSLVHESLREAWLREGAWLVGDYLIMPDHIHLFCAPGELSPCSLRTWTKLWKSEASRHWPYMDQSPVWQRDFWDTQLRSGESYAEKWSYVELNPV